MDLNHFIETCDKHKDAASGLAFFAFFCLAVIVFGTYHIVDRLRQPREIHHYHDDDSE